MTIQSLFIRSNKNIAGIRLDAVTVESHVSQVRTTKSPVEFGADVTDNSIVEPKSLTITAEVSDSPVNGSSLGPLISQNDTFGSATEPNITRSNAAYNALISFQENKEPTEVQTRLKQYSNMLITNISTTQDKDSSKIASMAITMDEILILETEIIALSKDQLKAGSPQEQATSSDNKGRQEPQEPTENENKSVLKTISDWITE